GVLACASLLLLGGTLLAAPPAPSRTTAGGAISVSPAGGFAPGTRPARPRGGAFVTSLTPDARAAVRSLPPAAAPAFAFPDGYEVIVLAPHRPIRVRVAVLLE